MVSPEVPSVIGETIHKQKMGGSSAPDVLLITANVGSIFEEPNALISQWMTKVMDHIAASRPQFVAIHCQEVTLCHNWCSPFACPLVISQSKFP